MIRTEKLTKTLHSALRKLKRLLCVMWTFMWKMVNLLPLWGRQDAVNPRC